MANLVFKFNWDHRPYPYNAAQGKRQFMLPFASGIPNLTPGFSQIQNIPASNPASRNVGTSAGNIMEVGAFGLGLMPTVGNVPEHIAANKSGFGKSGIQGVFIYGLAGNNNRLALFLTTTNDAFVQNYDSNNLLTATTTFRTSANTIVDSSGFIKAASPVVKLFSDYIELNNDAAKQPITFDKLGTGDYLVKGSLGFAQEGWYIEVPKDANGNTIVAVVYDTLENGDISIKTYKRKFDVEKAAIVADLENPLDIPEGRWIDIRLHEEPEPEPEELLSETPVDFQPTNLSQAVAAAMNGVEPPEISDTDETL
ncbi:TPA: phage tail protein [Acinetobacter baumannii]|nr:phage tail protein [Acinetobacter baumannii]